MDNYKTHIVILILSLVGALVLASSIKTTLGLGSSLKFILLLVQIGAILYLTYNIIVSALSAWESWRWAPDKLR